MRRAGRLRARLAHLPCASPRLLISSVNVAIFAASGVLAFLLRFDFRLTPYALTLLAYALPLWVLAKTVVFRWRGLDRGCWRYTSVGEVVSCAVGNAAGSLLGAALILAFAPKGFPRSLYFLDLLVSMHASFAVRLCVRMFCDETPAGRTGATVARAFIYGAGSAGSVLLRNLQRSAKGSYEICGLLDDDSRKIGLKLHNVPILGRGRDLRLLAGQHSVTEVLIAIPSASGREMSRILEVCRAAGVRFKTVPSFAEIVSGSASPALVRDVAVEDLLGRSAVQLDMTDIRARLEGQVVLITGAAGSIGSELCRQIASVNPRAIVALDAGETPLFHIAVEMRQKFPKIPFFPEVGNIQNRRRLTEIFEAHAPSIVYHAAAYKHVPLMEANIFEAVENNVLGTFTLAVAAADHGVETFVMISSDKAVRPTNVMGATKRVAELLIRSLQSRSTRFVSVRFGNVLGSQGSVVPSFKRQIAAGGPVTVTHPEMRRYFMTIPEAVQLVLQASTIGEGGEIFVLDMGEPVKILDLAENLILLSGLRPGADIEIEFTGIRPGEKLYEELSTCEEFMLPTCHEKIKVFAGNGIPERMTSRVNALRGLCETRDRRGLILELQDIVPEYSPSPDLLPEARRAMAKAQMAA